MATTTIDTKELESNLSLIRDINKEMSMFLTATKAGLGLIRTMNDVEADVLKSMKGKNASEQASIDSQVKILNIRSKISDIMKRDDPLKGGALRKAYEQLFIQQKIQEKMASDAEHIKDAWKDLDKSFGNIYARIQKFVKLLRLEPELIALAAGLYILKKIYNVFDQLDSAAADFRKSMGITRVDSVKLESDMRAISVHLMAIGVSAKDVYGSAKAMADEFGSFRTYSSDIVSDMATLTAQFGVTAQTSAKFVKSMAMVSGSTSSTQKDMLMIAKRMSAAAGVPLDAVMHDVAESSQESYQFLSRNPLELLKAAVNAKELGTTLSSSAKSSASLLNFTESVKAEMEASVLLGKSMNLQKARELAYHRDIVGLNAEIVRLAKDANFEQLDPFQQDAVAKALGKSAGEVANMLESDREHSKVLAAMSVTDRARYNEMTKMNQSKIKDYAAMARQEVQSMSNQKATAAISAAWNSIFAEMGAVLLPKIAYILTAVASGVKWVADKLAVVNQHTAGWGALLMTFIPITIVSMSRLGKLLHTIGIKATEIGNFFKFSKIAEFGTKLAGIGEKIQSIFKMENLLSFFGKVGKLFGRFLIPLMFAYNIFLRIKKLMGDASYMANTGFVGALKNIPKAIGAIFMALWDTINDLFFGLPNMLLRGIVSVSESVYNAIKSPFIKAWDWLKGTFLGNSPSQLGLMILDGITAVESLIVKALISPFTKAWDFIKGLPIISHFFGTKDVGAAAGPEAKASMTVERPKAEVDSKKATGGVTDAVSGMGDDMAKRMGAIVDAINSLRDDMKNGVLTANVYLDSQHLDSRVGRRLSYTGTLT